MLSMLLYEPLYTVDLISPEPATTLQSNGVEPEFGDVMFVLNMNVGWLLAIPCIKEKSIRTNSQYSRHQSVCCLPLFSSILWRLGGARSTKACAQLVSYQLTNASMDGTQRGLEGPPGMGLDARVPTSIGLRNPSWVSSPGPLIRPSLATASTRLSHQAEIALALAEVVQGHAAAALILYAELSHLRYCAPLIPKHAARAIPWPVARGSARDHGRHSVRSF
jgi:hypothetical protein